MGQKVRCGFPSETELESDYRRISEGAVRKSTGKGWDEWFLILDEYGVEERGHSIAVKHLQEHYGLDPRWAEAVTLRYEDARGLRSLIT
jgi:hypothetical protein